MAEGQGGLESQEIQVTKASVTEINSVRNTPQAEFPGDSINIAPERSLNRDILEYGLGGMALENSPHVMEHLGSEKIGHLADEISDFYNFPQDVRNRGQKADVYIVKDESLAELEEMELMNNKKGEMEKLTTEEDKNKFRQSIKKIAQQTQGKDVRLGEGKRVTLIKNSKKDDGITIPHEMLHVMVRDEKIKIAGLGNNNLDEAATEALALHFKYQNLDIENLTTKILNGEIKSGYGGHTARLLTSMYSTEFGDKPFGFKELSQYYSHSFPVKDGAFAQSMIKDLLSRMPVELQKGSQIDIASLLN
jgi:hypothetical protein